MNYWIALDKNISGVVLWVWTTFNKSEIEISWKMIQKQASRDNFISKNHEIFKDELTLRIKTNEKELIF